MSKRLAIIYSRAARGLEAPLVRVETHISNGLPKLNIVGLPETAVRESKDRVRSAIINSDFEFPARRITINLSPADLPKEGGRFDLPIALGILAASNQIPVNNLDQYEFAGELALTGHLRAINAILPFAIATRRAQRQLMIPHDNALAASMPQDNIVYGATTLKEVCSHLQDKQCLKPNTFCPPAAAAAKITAVGDLSDIQGQEHAKRALEVSAAGGHSMLMCGPPGTGKTMLAMRLIGILPPLTLEQAIELEAIHSVCKFNTMHHWRERPFRAPHHTISPTALVGGCSPPQPGEISLAHHGVLFLDELPEFQRKALEVLREPLETGSVIISRAAHKSHFPAQFQLIAAMNPCPCGYRGHLVQPCRCTLEQVLRYQGKISGPLLDRIDLHIDLPGITLELLDFNPDANAETSENVRQRVQRTMEIQVQRCEKLNAKLNNREIDTHCQLNTRAKQIMRQAMENLALSARGYYRILRVSRTIADLAQEQQIQAEHLLEALGFRSRIPNADC